MPSTRIRGAGLRREVAHPEVRTHAARVLQGHEHVVAHDRAPGRLRSTSAYTSATGPNSTKRLVDEVAAEVEQHAARLGRDRPRSRHASAARCGRQRSNLDSKRTTSPERSLIHQALHA